MFVLIVLCLLATTGALPVLPELYPLSNQVKVTVAKIDHEDVKDSNKAVELNAANLKVIPNASVLPSLDESILGDLIKPDDINIHVKAKADKSQSLEEASRKDAFNNNLFEPKKDEVTVEETQIDILKPNVYEGNVILGISIPLPIPPIFNVVMPVFNLIPFPSISSIKWPFPLPSIFNDPEVTTPDYVG